MNCIAEMIMVAIMSPFLVISFWWLFKTWSAQREDNLMSRIDRCFDSSKGSSFSASLWTEREISRICDVRIQELRPLRSKKAK